MTDVTGSSGSGFDILEFLRAHGASEEDIARAKDAGPEALRRLTVAQILLGGPPTLSRERLLDLTGAHGDVTRRLWRAMGFADVPDDVEAFGPADLEALRLIEGHLEDMHDGPTDAEVAIRFSRLLGQVMGRITDALIDIWERSAPEWKAELGVESDEFQLLAMSNIIPLVEQEMVYLFRRHLYETMSRRLGAVEIAPDDTVVGFADVVQFTRLSGQMAEADLAELLETFEAETTDLIASHGGRVVKLIGDAVMFEIDDDEAAAELALSMTEEFGGDRPDLRVGLAHGPVMSRQGDLFGQTVNLASRLVGFARPGTVLIDGPLADHVKNNNGFRTKRLRPRELKGIGETSMYVLRRSAGQPTG